MSSNYVFQLKNRNVIHETKNFVTVRNAFIAEKVSQIKSFFYGPSFTMEDLEKLPKSDLFFLVPDDTIMLPLEKSQRFGLLTEEHLAKQYFTPESAYLLWEKTPAEWPRFLGGLVSEPFDQTKIVVHKRIDKTKTVLKGWSDAVAESLEPYVLPGFSVFDKESADKAIEFLLPGGNIRIKNPLDSGGTGQWTINSQQKYNQIINEILRTLQDQGTNIAVTGLVFERELINPYELSIGQQFFDGHLLSFIARQKFMRPFGIKIYTGVEKIFVRGGYAALLSLPLPELAKIAVDQVIRFEQRLVNKPGIYITRSAYNVLQGYISRSNKSHLYSGVVEQTWRIGGGTGGDLLAHEAFKHNTKLHIVSTCVVQEHFSAVDYLKIKPIEKNAMLTFDGPTSQNRFVRAYSTININVSNLLIDRRSIEKILYPSCI